MPEWTELLDWFLPSLTLNNKRNSELRERLLSQSLDPGRPRLGHHAYPICKAGSESTSCRLTPAASYSHIGQLVLMDWRQLSTEEKRESDSKIQVCVKRDIGVQMHLWSQMIFLNPQEKMLRLSTLNHASSTTSSGYACPDCLSTACEVMDTGRQGPLIMHLKIWIYIHYLNHSVAPRQANVLLCILMLTPSRRDVGKCETWGSKSAEGRGRIVTCLSCSNRWEDSGLAWRMDRYSTWNDFYNPVMYGITVYGIYMVLYSYGYRL